MKKAIKNLYLVSFALNLLLLVFGIVLFFLGVSGVDIGMSTGMEVLFGILGFILYGLLALVSSAARKDCDSKPAWKRPHVLNLCLSVLGLQIVGVVTSILALIEFSNREEYGESNIKAEDPLTFLHLNRREKFIFKFTQFFIKVPVFFKNLGIKIGLFFKKVGVGIYMFFKKLIVMFKRGTYRTKLSYLIMGYGNLSRKQIGRGVLFLLFEVVFVVFMIFIGGKYISQIGTLGEVAVTKELVPIYIPGVPDPVGYDTQTVYVDNSFRILLYGVLTMFFIVAFIVTWYMNIKQAYANDQIVLAEKKLATDKDDIHALIDQDFYKTLLALPLIGILVFTVMPLFFMILVAFTNYDKTHFPPNNLFSWVGLDNFSQLVKWDNGGQVSFAASFGEILVWTLIWAFFATFTNYFLGMLVAMLINKKGIKLKKLWRTILVFSIAIPQFISLLYVSKMFADNGIINGFLQQTFRFKLPFWTDPTWSRITVIIINIWIGIPYLMLITTGILMNIPADLYESSKIDGASPFQQYMKITLPYMLFVTGPYLLTSFTGNMNNFNVIFLLSGGGPKTSDLYGAAGRTDLLITWLFSLTVNDNNYKLAAVIGIMVFVVVAVLSLIVYNLIPSTKNEEDYA